MSAETETPTGPTRTVAAVRHEADVAVIGAGMAGASLAAEVAARGASVVLVEAEATPGHHTTGRSAAAYTPAYGNPTVRAVTARSREHFDRISAGLGRPVLTPRAALYVSDATPESRAALTRSLDDRVLGLRPLDAAATVEACRALRPDVVTGGALDLSAHDIDVAAVHQHYLAALRRAGGTVVTEARVLALGPTAQSWAVQTAAGPIVATIVVDAAGAWCDHVATLAGVRPVGIAPLRRTIAVCRLGAVAPDPDWPLVLDACEQWYFRPEGDGILVSPADETPTEPCDARPDELDVALAIERVNEHTTLGLRSVRTAWAGLRSFAPDRSPVVGFDPGAEGFFWYGGQGGYGIQMAPGLAALGADMVLNRPLDVEAAALAAAIAPSRPTLATPVPTAH